MRRKQVIAVDIDDVLAAEAEFIIAYGNKQWGHTLTLEDYQENWSDMWGVDMEEMERRAAQLHLPGVQTSYRLIEGGHEVLKKLKERYELIILTSRRGVLKVETLEWINRVFADVFSGIHFTGFYDTTRTDRHLLTKGELAKQVGADFLIDDQPKHCFAAAEAGVKSLLFGDYAFSRHLELPPGVSRCKDWAEVLDYFDGQQR
jgi:uncharacterized HAD superfamily protein